MSRFSGPQRKGAQAEARTARREAAETRNALTPPERRRRPRLDPAARRLLAEIFGGDDEAGRVTQ